MVLLPAQEQPLKIFLVATTVLLVAIMTAISIVYLAAPRFHFTINQTVLGWLGWATLATSSLYISLKYKKECFFIFLAFFIFGFFSKAYLEPASDQIDHLYRTHEKCRNIDNGTRLNTGLWQYGMNSVFLCEGHKKHQPPEYKLFTIDLLHGLYLGFASTILYTISRNAGLPAKWSLLSVIISTAFMGTNKFSYFRYYSYGPSFTSLCIYWIWISTFFFSIRRKMIFLGLAASLPLITIMAVNHIQEAVFLFFLTFFWITINATEKIFYSKNKYINLAVWIVIIFLTFYIFPQFKAVQEAIQIIPFKNMWEKNLNVVYFWNNIHVTGKIWQPQYRVTETIGLIGTLPLAISPLLFFANKEKIPISTAVRVTLLGSLPFLVFCTPLFHYLWVAHVKIPVYYRIAYSSLFWIPIAYFLYAAETLYQYFWSRRRVQDS